MGVDHGQGSDCQTTPEELRALKVEQSVTTHCSAIIVFQKEKATHPAFLQKIDTRTVR